MPAPEALIFATSLPYNVKKLHATEILNPIVRRVLGPVSNRTSPACRQMLPGCSALLDLTSICNTGHSLEI